MFATETFREAKHSPSGRWRWTSKVIFVIFFEGITKEEPERFLMKKYTVKKTLKQDPLPFLSLCLFLSNWKGTDNSLLSHSDVGILKALLLLNTWESNPTAGHLAWHLENKGLLTKTHAWWSGTMYAFGWKESRGLIPLVLSRWPNLLLHWENLGRSSQTVVPQDSSLSIR